MEIIETKVEDLEAINSIIARSKAYWSYEDKYLDESLPLLRISSQWLQNSVGYSISNPHLIGFMGVETDGPQWMLEHLWIDPDHIGKGFGRKAFGFLVDEAKKQNARCIVILPDPPAEGFYSKMGAEYTGKVVKSRVPTGPTFREMIVRL